MLISELSVFPYDYTPIVYAARKVAPNYRPAALRKSIHFVTLDPLKPLLRYNILCINFEHARFLKAFADRMWSIEPDFSSEVYTRLHRIIA